MAKSLLIFAGFFLPHVGGYENVIYDISKKLSNIGYDLDIITLNTENVQTFQVENRINIYRLPTWNLLNNMYPFPKPNLLTFKILINIAKKDYSVVNTQTRFMSTSLLGLVFSKIKRIPLVHTEHGTRHSIVGNRFIDFLSKVYDHLIGSLIVRSARKNVGVSRAACNFLAHLDANNLVLIYNAIDTSIFKKIITNKRDELGLENCIIVVYHGRLIYAKGIQDLIIAFTNLKKTFCGLKLLIIGEGNYRSELETLTKKLCSEGILFLGKKNRAEIIEFLSISDIFVNPSYSEGLPTSVLEAGSVGLPIVATNIGGTNEIIEDYENGILYPPGEIKILEGKISELIMSGALRERLGKNARNSICERFAWDEAIRNYDIMYSSITK